MEVTELGIVMLAKLPQFRNEPSPREITEFGIVTLVSLSQPKKA